MIGVRWSEAGYVDGLGGCFLFLVGWVIGLGAVVVLLLAGVVWWQALLWPFVGVVVLGALTGLAKWLVERYWQ